MHSLWVLDETKERARGRGERRRQGGFGGAVVVRIREGTVALPIVKEDKEEEAASQGGDRVC